MMPQGIGHRVEDDFPDKGLETGVRNANDAISMISTADGALIEVGNMLQRMRELALQSANGTATSADRDYLNAEYENLIAEIERIAQNTQWNGKAILTGDADTTDDSTVAFQVGANGGQTIEVNFGDIAQSGATPFHEFELSAHKERNHTFWIHYGSPSAHHRRFNLY